MKIIFNRQAITDALAPLMCAVSNNATKPAVRGVLINAKENGECVLTTFDLEKGMRVSINAEVKEAGSAIISAQKLLQTVRVMEGENVTLTVDESLQACIYSGKSNHKMNALDAADYPEIPRLVTEDGFVIGQAVLRKMLSKVMYAMGVNDQRPFLNGCYFVVQGDELLLVSCDSYRLAKCSVKTDIENKNEDGSDLKFRFIVPNKSVIELYKLLKDDERETARIYMTRKNIVINIGGLTFFSRLIEGQYMDYDRIILKDHSIYVRVNRERLIAALERAALVTEEKVTGSVRAQVRLEFVDGVLKISATSTLGSTYDEVDIEQEGGNLLIAFNNRFLIESLRVSEEETVRISMKSAFHSINIEPDAEKEDGSELFMILPVRIRD